MPDLPVMEGLAEDGEASLVFDKPGGRIADLVLVGALAPAAVRDYYAATLPALGWRAAGPGEWRREGERLRLAIAPQGPSLQVRFTLSPE